MKKYRRGSHTHPLDVPFSMGDEVSLSSFERRGTSTLPGLVAPRLRVYGDRDTKGSSKQRSCPHAYRVPSEAINKRDNEAVQRA